MAHLALFHGCATRNCTRCSAQFLSIPGGGALCDQCLHFNTTNTQQQSYQSLDVSAQALLLPLQECICGNSFLEWKGHLAHIGLCPGCTRSLGDVDAHQRVVAAFDRSFPHYTPPDQEWLVLNGFRGQVTPAVLAEFKQRAFESRLELHPAFQRRRHQQSQYTQTRPVGPSTPSVNTAQQHSRSHPQMSPPQPNYHTHVTPVHTPPTHFHSPAHATQTDGARLGQFQSATRGSHPVGSTPFPSHFRPAHLGGNASRTQSQSPSPATHATVNAPQGLDGNGAQLAAVRAQKRHELERAQQPRFPGNARSTPTAASSSGITKAKPGRLICSLCKKDKPIIKDRNDGKLCTPCFKDCRREGDQLRTLAEQEKQQEQQKQQAQQEQQKQQVNQLQTPSSAERAPAPSTNRPQTPVPTQSVIATPSTSSSPSAIPSQCSSEYARSQPQTPNLALSVAITPSTTPSLSEPDPQEQQSSRSHTPTPSQRPTNMSTDPAQSSGTTFDVPNTQTTIPGIPQATVDLAIKENMLDLVIAVHRMREEEAARESSDQGYTVQ
ncbi:hypothetical protein CB0940_07120 [Cercospora beticola]|uniref:Uncharacterized protein n=1 Tax=Cercospora beticola TaxID=122368 RepID=A0A2G5HAB1_CERBT|nr:hypothetical protein CB0940_07120 [Cercospora beticola]PIA89475.1 hypothetical protein CB0940_07120 [Cercospora beticola]WPB03045.1 hypothetical protein RHO25_007682 [Cercospora beticola]